MANSREAQSQWNVTKVMSAGGWEYVGWLELPHYRLIKLEEERLLLAVAGEDYGLTSVNDARSGKPRDPERQRLAEIIDRLNDLYGAEVSDDGKLYFFRGLAGRLSKDEPLMRQVVSHSEDQAMHGLLPSRFINIIMDTMSDNEKMAMPLLDDAEMADKACRIIFKMLVQRHRDTNGKGF